VEAVPGGGAYPVVVGTVYVVVLCVVGASVGKVS